MLPASSRRVSSATVVAVNLPGPDDHCDHPAGSPAPGLLNRSSAIGTATGGLAGPTRRLSKATSPAVCPPRANPTWPAPRMVRSVTSMAAVRCRVYAPSRPRYWFESPRWKKTLTLSPSARTLTVTHRLLT